MECLITAETEKDYPEVYQVNALAFGQENESKLIEELRPTAHYIPELSLVAKLEGQLVGHILFSLIDIIDTNVRHSSLTLAPLAVHPDFQKQGIGSQLVAQGLAKARSLGYSSAIVLGHPQYYPRFGFVTAAQWNIRCPFEVPSEAFMAIELLPGGLQGKSGVVKFADAFEGV